MNRQVVGKWFEDYKSPLESKGIIDVPSHIWNLDESGLQDTFKPKHAVGEKGMPLYQIQHSEKGETRTVVPVFNAMGVFGPLLIVFKGKRVKSEWLTNVPENVMVKCSDDGWINKGFFLEFGKKFVSWLPKDDKRPHVLLMDGHGSHVFNLDFINLMKANNIEVFCFPPHTTHWLQPADKAVFKTFKTEWVKEGLKFNNDTAGRKPSKVEFLQLFKKAWGKAATVEVVQGGFRGTGMFPWNPNAIPGVAYCASATTERLYEMSAQTSTSGSDVVLQSAVQQAPAEQTAAEAQASAEQTVSEQTEVEPQAPAEQTPAEQTPAEQTPAEAQASAEQTEVEPQAPAEQTPAEQTAAEAQASAEQTEVEPQVSAEQTPAEQTPAEPQTSTERRVTFSNLSPPPVKERTTTRKRKQTSYHLTGHDHTQYLEKLANEKQGKKAKCRKSTAQSTAKSGKRLLNSFDLIMSISLSVRNILCARQYRLVVCCFT